MAANILKGEYYNKQWNQISGPSNKRMIKQSIMSVAKLGELQ